MRVSKIITAKVSNKDIPSPEDIAAYVESLKLYLQRNQVKDEELQKQIKQLPSPKQIIRSFSIEEIRLLTESIGYLWKKITGKDIIAEAKMTYAPQTLHGNYWMLTKGVIISGVNHYTIIKQNLDLFRTLLDINAFVMHDRLASNPNDIIKLVLDHGGMRIFVNDKKEAYFQLSDETYTKWGRAKIKKYDFKKKITKVIDSKQKYNGWSSGIVVII